MQVRDPGHPDSTRQRSAPMTSALVLAAIFIHMLGWVTPDRYDQIVAWLGIDSRIGEGQPWRVLTEALLHITLAQLAFSAFFVWRFGSAIERRIGSLRMLGLFAVLAAATTTAQWALLSEGAGLSGVAFGLFGVLKLASRRDSTLAPLVDRNTTTLFIGWFLFCLALTYSQVFVSDRTTLDHSVLFFMPNVAHAAGWIIGATIGAATQQTGRARMAWSAGTIVLVVAFTVTATSLRPLVNLSPDAGLDLADRAFIALEDGRYAEAAALSRRAIAYREDRADYWSLLAHALEQQDRLNEARAAIDRALAIQPMNEHHRAMRDWIDHRLAGGS